VKHQESAIKKSPMFSRAFSLMPKDNRLLGFGITNPYDKKTVCKTVLGFM